MGSLNRVLLLGYLGRDMETRTAGTSLVGSFSLATSETWRDKGGQKQEKTEWHRIVLWGDQAEKLAPYLKKGKQILIEGSLTTRQWEDQEGTKRYMTEVKAQRVTLLGSGSGSGGSGDDEGSGGGGGSRERQRTQPPADPDFGGADDDVPF
jgi:single-strand DNA-binding protein